MGDYYQITLLVTSEHESAIVDLYTQRCWIYRKLETDSEQLDNLQCEHFKSESVSSKSHSDSNINMTENFNHILYDPVKVDGDLNTVETNEVVKTESSESSAKNELTRSDEQNTQGTKTLSNIETGSVELSISSFTAIQESKNGPAGSDAEESKEDCTSGHSSESGEDHSLTARQNRSLSTEKLDSLSVRSIPQEKSAVQNVINVRRSSRLCQKGTLSFGTTWTDELTEPTPDLETVKAAVENAVKVKLKRKGGSEGFLCNVCNFAFPTKISFEKHLLKNKCILKCETCSKVYPYKNRQGYLIHLQRHKEQYDFNRHQKSTVPLDVAQTKESPESVSDKETVMTPDENVMKVVGKRKNTGEGFFCDICNWTFKRKTTYDKHFWKNRCILKCRYCSKVFPFRDRKGYRSHVKRHMGQLDFKCDKCSKQFVCKPHYLRHQRLVHSKEGSHKCENCVKTFPTELSFIMHNLTYHGENKGIYPCPKCTKAFNSVGPIREHLKLSHGMGKDLYLPCSLCGKLLRPGSLKRHMEITHTQTKTFKCDLCSAEFKWSAGLQDHMMRHIKSYKLYCEICGLGCYGSCILRDHMRTHTGEKPYACTLCDYRCAVKCNLNKHMKIHQKFDWHVM